MKEVHRNPTSLIELVVRLSVDCRGCLERAAHNSAFQRTHSVAVGVVGKDRVLVVDESLRHYSDFQGRVRSRIRPIDYRD